MGFQSMILQQEHFLGPLVNFDKLWFWLAVNHTAIGISRWTLYWIFWELLTTLLIAALHSHRREAGWNWLCSRSLILLWAHWMSETAAVSSGYLAKSWSSTYSHCSGSSVEFSISRNEGTLSIEPKCPVESDDECQAHQLACKWGCKPVRTSMKGGKGLKLTQDWCTRHWTDAKINPLCLSRSQWALTHRASSSISYKMDWRQLQKWESRSYHKQSPNRSSYGRSWRTP